MKTAFFLVLLLFSLSTTSQDLNVYFGNLHSHTSYSDGSSTPDVAYQHARDNAMIDFLAITEHNHANAPSELEENPQLYNGSGSNSLISIANRFNEDDKFVAIYGQEYSSISSGNHANVLEVGEVIQRSQVKNGDWRTLIDSWLIENLDSEGKPAILLLNHPATRNSPDSKEYGRDDFESEEEWIKKLDAHAQLINIVNGPSHSFGNPGKPSEDEFLRYLNLGLHLAPTADQDNHKKNWGDAADNRTGVITTRLTKDNILSAIRNRNVYASQDKNLEVIATFNGELIGKIFSEEELPTLNSEIDISIKIKDPDEPRAIYKIDVFKDEIGGSVATVVAAIDVIGDQEVQISGIKYTGENEYYFIKISQTHDDGELIDHAWLAPVWMAGTNEISEGIREFITLNVNVFTEEATITNLGTDSINLKNWTLLSVSGGQKFEFKNDLILAPGTSKIITSGKNAKNEGDFVKWTESYVWSNSKDDPGQLIDSNGRIVATSN